MIWHRLNHSFSTIGETGLVPSLGLYWFCTGFDRFLLVSTGVCPLLIACLALATWPQVPWRLHLSTFRSQVTLLVGDGDPTSLFAINWFLVNVFPRILSFLWPQLKNSISSRA